eukprot:4100470-Lingulodinium_polyedra.AAC.1
MTAEPTSVAGGSSRPVPKTASAAGGPGGPMKMEVDTGEGLTPTAEYDPWAEGVPTTASGAEGYPGGSPTTASAAE